MMENQAKYLCTISANSDETSAPLHKEIDELTMRSVKVSEHTALVFKRLQEDNDNLAKENEELLLGINKLEGWLVLVPYHQSCLHIHHMPYRNPQQVES
jgi:hypothetical protein